MPDNAILALYPPLPVPFVTRLLQLVEQHFPNATCETTDHEMLVFPGVALQLVPAPEPT